MTSTSSTDRRRPSAESSTPTASRSTTPSGRPPSSGAWRQAETLPEDLDVGYRVLLDKDGRTAAWPAATYRAHIPEKPTATEYRALVEEFWWDTTYVAKALWRGEVVFAKFVLDHDAKHVALRQVLEWRIELDHEWSLRPGAYGRGLERHLPDDLRSELSATYVGTDIEDNWNALFRTTALFRRVATEVGDALRPCVPARRGRGRHRAPRSSPACA